jgi:hypothetical protein
MTKDEIKSFPSYEEMYNRFISEGVKEDKADREAKALCLLSEPVKERFLHWWHTGELIDDLEIVRIKISSCSLPKNFRFPTAFIDFDSLYSEPLKTRTTITEDEDGYLTFTTRDISD